MAIAFKSAGAGVATESSGAALSPACPAVVAAGDILILQTAWEGTTSAPSPPGDWTLLSGPEANGTVFRHWVYGKIADGTEDGAAVALGSPAVTTQRAARIFSFDGRVEGTIDELVPAASFSVLTGANDPTGPTVATTVAGALACAVVYQNDNNTLETFAGASDTWTERGTAGGYIFALNPGGVLDLLTATPAADPGTVSGGAMTVTNDPWIVIGFEIRPSAPVTAFDGTDAGTLTDTGAVAQAESKADTEAGTLSETGQAVETVALAGTDAAALAETGAALETQALTGTDTGTLAETSTQPATLVSSDAGAIAETPAVALAATEAGALAEAALVPAALSDTEAGTVAEATSLDQGGTTPTDDDQFTLALEDGVVVETVVGGAIAAPAVVQGWAMIGPQRPHRKKPKTRAEEDAEEREERKRRQQAIKELLLTVLADV